MTETGLEKAAVPGAPNSPGEAPAAKPAPQESPAPGKRPANQRAAGLIAHILAWAGLVFFGLFTLASLLASSRLATNDPDEVVSFRWDLFPLTLLVFALFMALCLLLRRRSGLRRPAQRTLLNALTLWVLAVGTAWVFLMRAAPYADSYWVYTLGNQFSAGYWPALQDEYIRYFPFQLGYVFFLEWIARLFGGENFLLIQLLNVGFVALGFRALVKTAALLFRDSRVASLLTLLLFGCLQPVLYATLVYGTVPGLAMGLLCLRFTAGYVAGGRRLNLVWAVLFAALAVMFKNNFIIFAIAAALVLALHFIKAKKPAALVGAAALALAAAFALWPVYRYYQARSGQELPAGMPKVLWVAMGLQESPKAPGWFNDYSYEVFAATGEDAGAAAEIGRESIGASLAGFARDPLYALRFFTAKNLAQWNEPSYAAIQQAHVLNTHTHALSPLARSLAEGRLEDALFEYFNLYHFAVAALALAFFVLKRRQATLPQLLFLLAILGGFAFHTVWEGKAQYIWPYFVLCLPYAAAGLATALDRLNAKLAARPGKGLPKRP